jgi:hypothetical protein
VATVAQAAGAGTLAASSAASGATTCKNLSTGGFACGVTFSATALSISIPSFVAGKTVATNATACTVPNGTNSVNFYTGFVDPVSGTKQLSIAPQTAGVCGAYTAISTNAAAPTTLNLTFASNVTSVCLTYPDVGKVRLSSTVGGASTVAFFTAVPDHFLVSSPSCVTGCKLGTNPAATNASDPAFMKAGAIFSLSVTAYNGASTPTITPNFGKEIAPEAVVLTPAANMPDLVGAIAGNLTCSTPSSTCANGPNGTVVLGGFGATTPGVASNSFVYDEVGIMTLTPMLDDPDSHGYVELGNGALNPSGWVSGNIGRFIADHFEANPDALNPILARAGLPQTTALAIGTTAPATLIDVDTTTGFYVGGKVRIPGAGTGGTAFAATVTAVDAVGQTLTLDTPIGSTLAGGESVISEWGSYMGEPMNANFVLSAMNVANNVTSNYEGAYAKLDLTAGTNPLGLGAVDATGPTYNLLLDTSAAATGSFINGSATISAPLAVVRGSTAVGPYNAVKVGIAPSSAETDGVKMGAYDLSVAGGANDHTSIMDPLVQAVTQVRYGRLKISNAYGSELLTLPVRTTAQYYDGTTWVTNLQDSLTTPGGPLAATAVTGTPLCTGLAFAVAPVDLLSGLGSFTLTRPANGRCSADIVLSLPSYLPSVSGRVTFGIYKSPLIYRRENY